MSSPDFEVACIVYFVVSKHTIYLLDSKSNVEIGLTLLEYFICNDISLCYLLVSGVSIVQEGVKSADRILESQKCYNYRQ